MSYNHGREERKWRLWKESEERQLRELGVDEDTIEQLRVEDRAVFNSDRRFYTHQQEAGTYLETLAESESHTEVWTVCDLLDEIENEKLYQILLTVDKRTMQIILLKMCGYTTKEIAPIVCLSAGAVYARLDQLKKKLKNSICK
ncbi:MAG: sigma-70 family RNA polymerase sigma factor [Acutalibacter sp.]|nr:sigma-70 family RNA polymerase sigma factor [Acutalibacter sp.]